MAKSRKQTDALKRVKINGDKLYALLKEYKVNNGVSVACLGRELGYNPSFFSQSIHKNALSKVAVYFLESKGIHFEDYAPDPEPEVPELEVPEVVESILDLDELEKGTDTLNQTEPLLKNMTADEFSKLIYTAVYEAVSKAWENM